MSALHEIQGIQTAHRRRMLETWSIPAGSKVLEVGCGQGDMTAVLMEAVGPDGHVTAVDLASPTYGAPETLAEATEKIQNSPLGDRVDFHFECDIRRADFPENSFDVAVMAMSSWYFGSPQELVETLQALRRLSPRLAFAEWDLHLHSSDQLGHFTAVQIQEMIESAKPESQANVRTPLTQDQLKSLLPRSGWTLDSESLVDSPDLQDADWEIAHTLKHSILEAEDLVINNEQRSMLNRDIARLREVAKPNGNRPLFVYSLTAVHGPLHDGRVG
ncbi:MAG: class I SAM-dependent methyltransferase [Armatimonadetes bacterium]|nr:class I SAM-dependent methyltransferase [Armatimonadota bacterium]